MNADANVARLGHPRRIWAVSACRGPVDRLSRVHATIAERFVLGDRLLYLGDYLGDTESVILVDQILAFRAYLLAAPGMVPNDFVYLRGVQEEIWSKLLQIQYAPNPGEVLRWMLERGASETIIAYGCAPEDGILSAREGAVSLAKWTNRLRNAMRRHAGHDKLISVLRRAAITDTDDQGPLLFVHAGLDPARQFAEQGDNFWWGAAGFAALREPFAGFKRIFRGADPTEGGRVLEGYALTLSAGGRDNTPLTAVGVGAGGDIIEVIES